MAILEFKKRKEPKILFGIKLPSIAMNFYNEIKNTFNTDISKELFNNDYLMKILDEHKNREKDNYRRIWAVYSFLKWYEEYFVKR